ncbi:MAG: ATP-binding protein [Leptolyngbyaceae cyanobacterium RU_5_1]|nr:ATP-binding protein [Leptolyngbyaceae cyanobacterium RU_5_1]
MTPSKKPKSLQDILKQRQQSSFVGREAQIALFRQNVERSPELRDYFIFNVWGQGGVGKSTLLRQYRKLAEELGGVTAYTNEEESSVPDAIGRLAAQLTQQGQKLETFTERYTVYRQKKQELETDPEAPQGFSAFLGKSLAKAGLGLAKQIPGSGAVTPFLDEERSLGHLQVEGKLTPHWGFTKKPSKTTTKQCN